jgi:hypothetical protein
MATRPIKAAPLPHSWRIADWPTEVYPSRPGPGKYVVRANRDELLSLGALCRVGRDLVVIGEGYGRFLARKNDRVPGYVTPGLATPRDGPTKVRKGHRAARAPASGNRAAVTHSD